MAGGTQITHSVSGFGYFLQGLRLLGKPGVKRFVIMPLLINIALFALLFWLAGDLSDFIVSHYMSHLTGWWSWIASIIKPLIYLLAILIMYFSFSFVANLVGSPFNSYLAAAVEKHLTGKDPIGSERSFWAEFVEALLSEVKKWAYYALWAIPLIIISLFIAPIAPFLWFIFGAWMFSIEYLDYPMGNYGLTFSDIRKQIAKKRMLSLSFGSAVTLATMIPIFNFIVMPVAVAGATAMRVNNFPMLPKD